MRANFAEARRNHPRMHDDDELVDDSWFDRPRRRGGVLTVAMVKEALKNPGAEVGPTWEGLNDSWFDRKPANRKPASR